MTEKQYLIKTGRDKKIGLALMTLMRGFAGWDAYRSAEKDNRSTGTAIGITSLSLLFPGLGQGINEDFGKGFMIACFSIGFDVTTMSKPIPYESYVGKELAKRKAWEKEHQCPYARGEEGEIRHKK